MHCTQGGRWQGSSHWYWLRVTEGTPGTFITLFNFISSHIAPTLLFQHIVCYAASEKKRGNLHSRKIRKVHSRDRPFFTFQFGFKRHQLKWTMRAPRPGQTGWIAMWLRWLELERVNLRTRVIKSQVFIPTVPTIIVDSQSGCQCCSCSTPLCSV